ncbi:uncharacterized protein F4807DRAFT_442890 [Annulohypoxylon truncatum]|uniref:uncharacterized protein n=1 Tax=Annulohypoxylon truncatum TaxID=327061 RepID=UPI002008B5FB|nr:uncharacterized protein F4807DRAFT_442890 [Annulohypoxylon truncatum]KAI1205520.1 hypothetical protein F4807DRAFT_442890 [Annulohypoxylon truncatum]
MKPVEMADVSRGVFTKDSLLLLNISRAGPRYVRQLFARNNTSIRSKGGISLPNEIWFIIFEFTRSDIDDEFCLVKVNTVSASPDTVVLRCYLHEFDYPEDEELQDSLTDRQKVLDFERYLACATPSVAKGLRNKPPGLSRLSGPQNTFDVVLDARSKTSCLYKCIDVPDIISKIEGGWCRICRSERTVCPGCTGGVTERFDVFMGCGVELACPLCMGTEFSLDHKYFLDTYYLVTPPESEAEEWKDNMHDRLEELGYIDSDFSQTKSPTSDSQ